MRSFNEKLLGKRYKIKSRIGKGGFADVYEAEDVIIKEKVAIKIIDRDAAEERGLSTARIEQELSIHKILKHRNVVEMRGGFPHVSSDGKEYFCLVLEFCAYGDLQQFLGNRKRPLDERTAASILEQVVRGLMYLHSNHVIHRDLSLSNVFISSMSPLHVKIGDLGLSAKLRHPNEKQYTVCGTKDFMAPEIARRDAHGKEVDIWSLGIILQSLLTQWDSGGKLSIQAEDLLSKLLCKDPHKRIHLREVLCHPFIKPSSNMSLNSADSGHWSLPGTSSHGGRSRQLSSNASEERFRSRGNSSKERRAPEYFPPPVPRAFSDQRRARSAQRMEEIPGSPSGAIVPDCMLNSPSPSSPCVHSQYEQDTCRKCGERRVYSRCRSFRSAGTCRGTCKTESPKRNSGSLVRQSYVEPQQNDEDWTLLMSTERLKPSNQETDRVMYRLLPRGQISVEVLKADGKRKLVTRVLQVDPQNRIIQYYEAPEKTQLSLVEVAPAVARTMVQYSGRLVVEEMPRNIQKLFPMALGFIELLKKDTPKLTKYSRVSGAKASLMENGDFVVEFLSGKKAVRKAGSAQIQVEKQGCLTRPEEEEMQELFEFCIRKHSLLEASDIQESESSFPVTFGRRRAKMPIS